MKQFSVNYNQLKNFSKFKKVLLVIFLEAVYACFTPDDEYKIQAYAGRRNTSN